jgi:hypothetical protein
MEAQYQCARPPIVRPIPPATATTAPTTSNTIPIVHRIEIEVSNPTTNKMTPSTIMNATPFPVGASHRTVRQRQRNRGESLLPKNYPDFPFGKPRAHVDVPRPVCPGWTGPPLRNSLVVAFQRHNAVCGSSVVERRHGTPEVPLAGTRLRTKTQETRATRACRLRGLARRGGERGRGCRSRCRSVDCVPWRTPSRAQRAPARRARRGPG